MNAKMYVALMGCVLMFGQCQHEKEWNLSSKVQKKNSPKIIQTEKIARSSVKMPELPIAKLQVFKISADKDTLLECKEGTTIDIPAFSFVDSNGELVDGEVEFVVTEYYQLEHIMEANLSTTSGDKLLETGGMLNLRASAKGETVKIQEGKSIELGFPRKKEKRGMQLFSGHWDAKNVDWKLMPPPPPPMADCFEIEEEPRHEEIFWCGVNEVQPEYPGGYRAMMEYFSDTIVYPKAAKDSGICGTVYVQFAVEKDGAINDVSVVRGIEESLDSAAFTAVSMMPNWSPGKSGNKVVRAQFTVPIRFMIANNASCRSNPTYNSKYKKVFEEKMEEDEEYVEKAQVEKVTRYMLSTSKLGWINCDRFIQGDLVSMNADIGSYSKVNAFIVLDNYRSCLKGIGNGKFVSFNQLPRNEPFTMVVVKKIHDANYLAIYNGKVGESIKLEFQLLKKDRLKQEMENLVNKWKVLS